MFFEKKIEKLLKLLKETIEKQNNSFGFTYLVWNNFIFPKLYSKFFYPHPYEKETKAMCILFLLSTRTYPSGGNFGLIYEQRQR